MAARLKNSKSAAAPAAALACLCLVGGATWAGTRKPAQPPAAHSSASRYQAPVELPHLQDGTINESSGLAAARRNAGLVWTHNDSGDKPYVYAVDRQGNTAGVFAVRGATARDWEDMAWGPGPKTARGNYLYLGDIGDNNSVRNDCVVYRIPEPKVPNAGGTTQNSSAKQNPLPSEGATVRLPFAYPDGPHNAEALLVHPQTGATYIVTKEPSGVAGVYKFPLAKPGRAAAKVTLQRVGTITISGEEARNPLFPNLVTGGDIAPDGRRVVLCTYVAAYEFSLPAGAKNFDAIWKTKPATIALPPLPQTEAICYAPDGKSFLVSSEGEPCQMYRLDVAK